jgi:precorrin-2 dehydrogenase/sirohydrochlorin ferrochelatase
VTAATAVPGPGDEPTHYPVNLVVGGRRCLVVGAGAVAAQKARGLLGCGASVHVVAPDAGPEIRRLAAEGRLTWEARPYRRGDLDGCWLAVTATGEAAVNQAVADDGEAARVWVNAADDPARCSFTLPARLRQGPLLVTFSTQGRSPAVASWLRRRFSSEFGPEYATLIDLLSQERTRLQADGRATEGLSWQSALDSGMLELVRQGRLAEAKERLQACLSSSSG